MTKKDYELVADSLRSSSLWWTDSTDICTVILELADSFTNEELRFDPQRFINAATPCGREARMATAYVKHMNVVR